MSWIHFQVLKTQAGIIRSWRRHVDNPVDKLKRQNACIEAQYSDFTVSYKVFLVTEHAPGLYFVSVGEDLGVEIDYLLLKFNYLNLSLRHKVDPVDELGFHEQFFVNHIVLDLKKVLSHSFDRLIYCDPVQLREGIEPLELLVHQCEASVPARCHFELVLCFADRSDLFVLKLGLSKLVYNFLFKLLKGSELLSNQS